MTGPLHAGGHLIENLGPPAGPLDALSESYASATFAKRDGSTAMTGNMDMGENLITKMCYPKDILDATNKSYVDSEIAECLKHDGSNRAWGNLNMAEHTIEELKDVDSSTPAQQIRG